MLYIYIYIRSCIYICIRVVYMQTYRWLNKHVYIYVNVYTYMYICICIYVNVYICAGTYIHTCIHTHLHMPSPMQTTHRHMHMPFFCGELFLLGVPSTLLYNLNQPSPQSCYLSSAFSWHSLLPFSCIQSFLWH